MNGCGAKSGICLLDITLTPMWEMKTRRKMENFKEKMNLKGVVRQLYGADYV